MMRDDSVRSWETIPFGTHVYPQSECIYLREFQSHTVDSLFFDILINYSDYILFRVNWEEHN